MNYKRKTHDTQPFGAQPRRKWSVWNKAETRRQRVKQFFVKAVFCYGLFALLLLAGSVGHFAINGPLYQDAAPSPGCELSSKILDTPWAGISVAIAGERQKDANVNVYRPGSDEPMEIWTSKTDYFVGTSDPYIRQQYSSDDTMYIGQYYRAEATLDGIKTSGNFELLQAELVIL